MRGLSCAVKRALATRVVPRKPIREPRSASTTKPRVFSTRQVCTGRRSGSSDRPEGRLEIGLEALFQANPSRRSLEAALETPSKLPQDGI
mmetsp:Transcript_34161/g.119458  ORF Transcript_34161/g.119458 Transcript_34161/m.119458 type:complete len:90 (-) Transcript_34161:25-294(-)